MTADSTFADFVGRHYLLVVSSSVLGLLATTKKVGSYLARAIMAGLRRFPELHGAFYECRIKCARNRRRFEQAVWKKT